MVLVDSSVWIHFYNKSAHTPELDLILALGTASTTDLILTEVLQGFRLSDKNKYAIALNDLESCIYLTSFSKSIAIKAADYYRELRSKGITPRNTIDVYLATLCIENNVSLLTYDKGDFEPMSNIIGLKLIKTN